MLEFETPEEKPKRKEVQRDRFSKHEVKEIDLSAAFSRPAILLLRPALNFLLLSSVAIYLVAWLLSDELPDSQALLPEIAIAPQQREIAAEPFAFEFGGRDYRIDPVADYEITGLVVAANNPTGIADAYHDSNSVDIRDLCIIWGDNLADNHFKKFDYWAETWACFYQPKDRRAKWDFDHEALSNTHLLAASEHVRRTIKRVGIGDQVRLRGKLINYYSGETGALLRRSSLTRDDTGDGACEVMFVDEIEVLQTGAGVWRAVRVLSGWVAVGAAVVIVAIFLFMPLRHYRRF
jgi:hypothetical protein